MAAADASDRSEDSTAMVNMIGWRVVQVEVFDKCDTKVAKVRNEEKTGLCT
jgi:hypothetical protein